MKRQIIFVASTIEAGLGGIARSVPALANALTKARASQGFAGQAQRDPATQSFARQAGGPEVFFVAPKAKESILKNSAVPKQVNVRLCDGFDGVKQELEQLTQEPEQVSFIYHAGVWNSLNHFVARLGRRRGIPVIVSTRSMLDPWARNHRKWKKQLAWWAYARRDLLGSMAIHVTAELEAGYVREALGERCPPVIVVPNGVELPVGEILSQRREDAKQPLKRILFLSRIHEKKGVLDLIRAFGMLGADGWELVIAGNDDGGHQGICESLATKQRNADRIRFWGPVKDVDKWELYRSADLFVLPSYSENFGIVVGEALGMGVPVVTTTATPWGEFALARTQRREEELGLWVIEPGVEALKEGLRQVLEMPDKERLDAAARGAAWIRQDFSWEAIGKHFMEEVGKVIPQR